LNFVKVTFLIHQTIKKDDNRINNLQLKLTVVQ